jgi:hypothetical protein
MQDQPWHVLRRRELAAAAPVKRKKKVEPFVRVPLWWIRAAAQHSRSPTTLVLVELLYRSWKARSMTFLLPNVRLAKWGASRKIKRRVLRDLERGGLVTVEWRSGKSPIVTLTLL